MKTEPTAAPVAEEAKTGPRSPVVRFAKKFDYTWPASRAMTCYPAGFQGRVKAEVAEAAAAAGVLGEPVDEPAETK
jgi:hypothetical protein